MIQLKLTNSQQEVILLAIKHCLELLRSRSETEETIVVKSLLEVWITKIRQSKQIQYNNGFKKIVLDLYVHDQTVLVSALENFRNFTSMSLKHQDTALKIVHKINKLNNPKK